MAFIDELKNVTKDQLMVEPITPLEELHLKSKESMKHRMELTLLKMQAKLCRKFEELEGKPFKVERDVSENCSYITCSIENGDVFDRAGVVFMVLEGQLESEAVKEIAPDSPKMLLNAKYCTMALECLVHPRNPHVPALNGSYRYFEAETTEGMKLAWHGGGHDLKPVYLVEEDIIHFHKTIKDVCDKHDPEYYPKFKKICDQFFYNSIRGEHQGVGGIFFDGLSTPDLEHSYNFLVDCCNSIIPCYVPLVEKHAKDQYTEKEKQWQQIRRGRIVEFTFVNDRGTKFGLSIPGLDIESMLLTLPPNASWKFKHTPEVGTKEYEFLQLMKNPRDWV